MRTSRVSKAERDEMILDLINALTLAKSLNDVVLFLQDLLTKQELEILSKRLRIAKLLIKGFEYRQIETIVHTSHATVAKIATWLSEKGDGFRKTIAKLPEKKVINPLSNSFEWARIKRKYSIYFWPELLLEEIIKNSNKKQKERLSNILKTLEDKNDLHRRIEKLLRFNSSATQHYTYS